jgi:hypothetical protein
MLFSKQTGGFYLPSVHGTNIPADAVDVNTDTQFVVDSLAEKRLFQQDEQGNPVVIKPAEPTLPELKVAKKAQINGAFEQTMQMITAGYPQDEIASWGKQEQEARAFVANAESATPLIGALAETRRVDKPDLVARIIYKADAFAQISGQLIGKRQALEDAIDAAETAQVLEAISW